MTAIVAFFIIILAGIILSEVFEQFHLPYVSALIIAGIIVGPHVANIIEIEDTLLFIGDIGLIFLMFIAGTEVKLSSLSASYFDISFIGLINSTFPFLTGFGIGYLYAGDLLTALTLGVVFISSSVAVIIPTLTNNNLIETQTGKTIVATTVIQDVVSLILFGIILQNESNDTTIPFPILIFLMMGIVILVKLALPLIQHLYSNNTVAVDFFEKDVRIVVAVLLAIVIVFEVLGFHPIVAAFITGILFSEGLSESTEEKIKVISYGIFIPVFFLIVGLQTDISVFTQISALGITFAIVNGLIISKFFSGFIGAKLRNYSLKMSALFGFATIPQLSTTLAAAFIAREFDILDDNIITALVTLSVISAFISPLAINILSLPARKEQLEEVFEEELEEKNI